MDTLNLFGYMRLSKKSKHLKDGKPLTTDEELMRQKSALLGVNIPEINILSDGVVSGMIESRPVLNRILGWGEYQEQGSCIPDGGTLVVCELSRLSRDYSLLQKIIYRLQELNISVVSLDFPIMNESLRNSDNLTIKLFNTIMIQIMIYFASNEREYISNRTKMALALKREQGYILGRPKCKVSQQQLDKVYELYYIKREINSIEAMKMLGTKKSTFFKLMKEQKERRFQKMIDEGITTL